jgi:hypothetical protein
MVMAWSVILDLCSATAPGVTRSNVIIGCLTPDDYVPGVKLTSTARPPAPSVCTLIRGPMPNP